MAMRLQDAVSHLQRQIGDRGVTGKTQLVDILNMAQREVAKTRDWPELSKRDFVSLTAPYSTGTVSISNGSASLTGSGTTFTSAMEGRKFASSYKSPWYEISTFGSTTALTLADSWAETALSGATYVIYEDRVSMPSDCTRVYQIWYHDTNRRTPLKKVSPYDLHEYASRPGQAGEPTRYSIIENDSNGYIRIQVGPYAPESNYRLEVHYKKEVSELVLGAQETFTLSQDLIDLIIQRALYQAVRRDDRSAARELAVYEQMLQREWATNNRAPTAFQMGMVTQHSFNPYSVIDGTDLEE